MNDFVRHIYVIARTAASRPTLQHILGRDDFTACGIDIAGWSRAYQRDQVPQVACKRCTRTTNAQMATHRRPT